MPTLWKKIRFFGVPFILYLILGAYFLIRFEKGHILHQLNAYHHPFLDVFFKYFTFVGDGIFYGVVVLLLFFWRKKYGQLALLSFILSALGAQVLKKWVFNGSPRPLGYYGDLSEFHTVAGVSLHSFNSFPSGHTTTAFSCFLLLTLLAKKPYFGLFAFICAFLAGLSRVYLLQHFFVDVYFGAIIGTSLTLLPYLILFKPKGKPI